jgi:hypothetical protein
MISQSGTIITVSETNLVIYLSRRDPPKRCTRGAFLAQVCWARAERFT